MMKRKVVQPRLEGLVDDPQWYKDAVIYELRVRSYNDSNGDGIGDIRGLTEKLDYLQDLGVNALWLLPLCPSPGRDDGYDIANYTDVSPELGTLDDFREFLTEAHRRGLRVITELVLNHTSDQHPWFQRARRAPAGSSYRNFYVWSDTPEKYRDARIIFKDFEPSNWSWDPVAKSYFWHRFYAHQPDLNFENPDVRKAMMEVVDFWFELGVDGLRLDAVPYLFEREGTNCENLPETHAFLRDLRTHIDGKFKNRMLLAEANQWPEDAAAYFGRGDECHMNFHFPIMPRLFMSIHMEDRFPIMDILAQTPALPDPCQWALFLRNHDELTLEMVTDEERDYMYRAYAHDPTMRINLGIRRRLAPLVGNDRRKMELMNGLLCSLPGTPVLYYGDEIGMGDNVYLGDRNGVRTPMQWSADRNAGFSRANPQRLVLPVIIDPEYHYESLNVEAQQNNTNSLLWWTKRLLALRRKFQAFGRGTIEFLSPSNHRVLAFARQYGDETILVVANLSRFVQYVEMDLSKFKGSIPIESFGRSEFPPIGEQPYSMTLSGYAFYWFSLHTPRTGTDDAREANFVAPVIDVADEIQFLSRRDEKTHLESALASYIYGRRWFAGRDRDLAGVKVIDTFAMNDERNQCIIAMVRVDYHDGDPDTYALPLAIEYGDAATEIRNRSGHAVVAQLRRRGSSEPDGVILDALTDGARCGALVEAMRQQRSWRGSSGTLSAFATPELSGDTEAVPEPRPLRGEHRKAALQYGERFLLKVLRPIGDGPSSELETGRFLQAPGRSAPVAPVLGALEFRGARGEPITVATLHSFVGNEGTAWSHITQQLGRYYERVLTGESKTVPVVPANVSLLDLALGEPQRELEELVGTSLDSARLIGERLAQLHLALSSDREHPHFAPEPYSTFDQRSSYQSMRNLFGRVLRELKNQQPRMDHKEAVLAEALMSKVPALYACLEPLLTKRLGAERIRIHGDFHLNKVLYTGKDFVIIDFEADRGKPLAERRHRRSAVRDLASMITALGHAAGSVHSDTSVVREADRELAERWGRVWHQMVSASFLRGYLQVAKDARFVPPTKDEFELRLNTFLIGKAFDELADEIPRRSWRLSRLLRVICEMADRSNLS